MKLAINSRNVGQPKAFHPWAQFEQDVNRLLGNPWTLLSGDPGEVGVPGWVPALEVQERADRYTVALDLPGVRKEEVQVSFQEGILTVAGERKAEAEAAETTWHRRERRFGRFERRLELPLQVAAEAITATFKDGVLSITLPKAEAAKPRQVEIRAE
ncbi:MAG: Hsp20/alpha crystallin family protein [Verrucomicrobiota bacterium]